MMDEEGEEEEEMGEDEQEEEVSKAQTKDLIMDNQEPVAQIPDVIEKDQRDLIEMSDKADGDGQKSEGEGGEKNQKSSKKDEEQEVKEENDSGEFEAEEEQLDEDLNETQPLCHDSFKVYQITDQVFICQDHLPNFATFIAAAD